MKAAERWIPTKLVYDARHARFEAAREHVSPGSWFAVEQMATPCARAIAEHCHGRLLDCGCGRVPYYALYRDRVFETVCLDWSPDCAHVDVCSDLSAPLPFSDARFDSVLLADVLEHVREPAALLREIARVLAPSGKLIVSVPFLYRVHEAPHDYFRYTDSALRALVTAAGLHVLELGAYGGYPDVAFDLVNKALAGHRSLCSALVRASRLATSLPAYQRWRLRTQASFPLGYVLVAQAR